MKLRLKHVLSAGLLLAAGWGASSVLVSGEGQVAGATAPASSPRPQAKLTQDEPCLSAPVARQGVPTQDDPIGVLEDEVRSVPERLAALAAATATPGRALGAIRRVLARERAEPALTLALVRALALPALAADRDPETLALLCRHLEKAENPELALALGDALDARAPLLASALLQPLERASSDEARVVAARCLSRAQPAEAAWTALRRRLAEDSSPQVRGEVLLVLADQRPVEAELLALEVLDSDPQLCGPVTRLLVRSRSAHVQRRLAAGFLNGDVRSPSCRAHARALAACSPALLRETALGVSDRAELAVEALEHARAFPALEEVLAHGASPEARLAAERGLARSGRVEVASREAQ